MAKKYVLIYPVRDDKVWLARHKRGPFLDKLSGFGGRVEESDNGWARSAACREVFEESKVKIYPVDLRFVTRIYFYRQGECIECFVYILWRWEGEFRETAEMSQAVPYSKATLPFSQMTEGDHEWLPKLLDEFDCVPHVFHNEDWTLDRIHYEKVA